MPLEALTYSFSDEPPPDDVERFIRESEDRIDLFTDVVDAHWIELFVPCEARPVYQALAWVKEQLNQPTPPRLCEWGSGFGVAAGLAAWLGYKACGIEKEQILVKQAESLAEDFGLEVPFCEGDMDPEADLSAYRKLNLSPHDLDVVFAYPWPTEAERLAACFEKCARPGAWLVTYHGFEELRVRRKT